ncbi:MAG: response regulator [Dehalococcoidia bacterium]|nr:response regulator [Dehalococcoidia bacterium]
MLIADRNAHYRETLRRVLSHHAHCNIMGEAATLTEAVRLARRTDPDIALLDFDLVVNQSAARLRRLADAFPRLHVIVLLSEYSDDYREAVRKRWGYTCIAKEQAETQLDELVAESWPAAG